MEGIGEPLDDGKRNVLRQREKTVEETEVIFDKLWKSISIAQEVNLCELVKLACRKEV